MNVSGYKRGVGFCLAYDCEEYAKGVFLFNHGNDHFWCPRCKVKGRVVNERATTLNKERLDFYQVRMEYCYDAVRDQYRELAVLTDESMDKSGNVYTLFSPLIKTDKRALKVAEALLSALQFATEEVFIEDRLVKTQDFVLDFDKSLGDVRDQLTCWESKMNSSRLRRAS